MNIDTPDFQRGVVSAQKLLAVVKATQLLPIGEVTVGVPPNAESLTVTANAGNITVTGVQTGTSYVGSLIRDQFGAQSMTSVFDISAALDSQVTVGAGPEAPKSYWYVYSDSGVHVVVDLSAQTNQYGVRYSTLVPPSNISGDHPPVELQQVAATINSSTAPTIVPAPLPGQRIRLFGVNAGAAQTWLTLGPFGVGPWFVCTANTTLAVQLLPSGVPLPAATAFEITGAGAAGATGIAGATYTIESV